MRRIFIIFVSVTVVSLALTGCAPGQAGTDGGSGTPASSRLYGDVVADGTVTDKFGTYEKTTISPHDDTMQFNSKKVLKSAYSAGFSKAEILAAQKYVITFVAEQATDSTTVDGNASTWSTWEDKNASKYFDPSLKAALLKPTKGFTRSVVIMNNFSPSLAKQLPQLVRDGKPRFTSNTIGLSNITGGSQDGRKYLYISGVANTNYRVSPAVVLADLERLNPTYSTATLKKDYPKTTKSADLLVEAAFTFGYAVVKESDGSWKIAGYNTDFTLDNNWK
jgi:hypothetical protein